MILFLIKHLLYIIIFFIECLDIIMDILGMITESSFKLENNVLMQRNICGKE